MGTLTTSSKDHLVTKDVSQKTKELISADLVMLQSDDSYKLKLTEQITEELMTELLGKNVLPVP